MPIITACFLFFLALFPIFINPANAASLQKTSANKPVPAISYVDEKGEQKILEFGKNTEKNTITALHFWATWCAECIPELPQVDLAQGEYESKGLRVLSISLDGDSEDARAKVQKFFAEHHIKNLAPVFDSNMKAFSALSGRGLPTTIFVDTKGKEIARAEGVIDWKGRELKALIELQKGNAQ